MKITLTKPFKARLRKKPISQQGSILETIKRLGDDPHHPSLRTKRIRTTRDVFEARVDRANRISWKYGGRNEIVLLMNCNHDEVLRRR